METEEDQSFKVLAKYKRKIDDLKKSKRQLVNDIIDLHEQFKGLSEEYKEDNPSKAAGYKYTAKKINDLIRWHDLRFESFNRVEIEPKVDKL